MQPYGLPNFITSELFAKILESPKLLNYIYYTGKEYEYIDLFSLEPPNASDLLDKYIYVGRRIPKLMKRVGAFLDVRVNRYQPVSNKKSPRLIKYVEIDIDVLCHVDCQRTIRGTRDITIITLLQETLENCDLTGISENIEITSVTEILGLDTDYNGYTLRLRVVGFN